MQLNILRTEEKTCFGLNGTNWGVLPMLVLVWLIPGKESRQQQVFAKFEELATSEGRRPGNGLGLAFGKLVVEARGGQIWIGGAQELGGSAFVMRLSLVDEVK